MICTANAVAQPQTANRSYAVAQQGFCVLMQREQQNTVIFLVNLTETRSKLQVLEIKKLSREMKSEQQ